jgi:hypothetical protein
MAFAAEWARFSNAVPGLRCCHLTAAPALLVRPAFGTEAMDVDVDVDLDLDVDADADADLDMDLDLDVERKAHV